MLLISGERDKFWPKNNITSVARRFQAWIQIVFFSVWLEKNKHASSIPFSGSSLGVDQCFWTSWGPRGERLDYWWTHQNNTTWKMKMNKPRPRGLKCSHYVSVTKTSVVICIFSTQHTKNKEYFVIFVMFYIFRWVVSGIWVDIVTICKYKGSY